MVYRVNKKNSSNKMLNVKYNNITGNIIGIYLDTRTTSSQ